MRNTFLMGCLLAGATSIATAQQAPVATSAGGTINATSSVAPLLRTLPSASVNNVSRVYVDGHLAATGGGDYEYISSGKNFKDADVKSKEVSKEIAVSKTADIYIENSSRGIVIKTWDQPKVKVTTTIYYEGETKLTDDEWLEKVNLSLKTLGSSVKIKSGSIGGNSIGSSYSSSSPAYVTGTVIGFGSSNSSGAAVFNGSGQNIGTKSDLKRIVTVTVPAGSKLDIESKYAEVSLPVGIGDVNVEITNGNLEADNLGKLVLRSKYSNINVGDVKTAEVEFANGRFSAKNIDDLDIESKYSTIEMASAKKITLRSTNDEVELEEAGEVRGRKTYGNLRITKLNNSIELDGNNANVKIRKVGPSLSLVKIDGKYADIRVPLRETKNYSVDFAGTYSSVYGNFEKKPVVEEKATTSSSGSSSTTTLNNLQTITVEGRLTPARSGSFSGYSVNDSNSPSKFTAIVGDGKGLKVEIKCPNCTVDFK